MTEVLHPNRGRRAPSRRVKLLSWVLLAGGIHTCASAQDSIPVPLTDSAGDPARGRAIVANRQLGLCLLCHTGPIPEERFQGNLAPDLSGAGSRWSGPQLRARLVDPARFNPNTIMPAYYKADGLSRVPSSLRGKTILNAQQIEDVVAYLQTLRTPSP